MAKFSTLFSSVVAAVSVMAVTSCADDARFIGKWTEISPSDITSQVAGASKATSVLSLDFTYGQQKDGGDVTLSDAVEIISALENVMTADSIPVRVSVPAVATVDGIWSYDVDDDDDLLLQFDRSQLKVSIDPSQVTFVGAMPVGATDAALDSIKNIAMEKCHAEVVDHVSDALSRYTVVDDVNVRDDGLTLGLEIQSPKADMRFKRVSE